MTKKTSDNTGESTLYCSFCGKSQHEVRKLIAGPKVYICDECIELCSGIIKEEHKIPSLFVRTDNGKAVNLYKRLGFEIKDTIKTVYLN